MGGLNFARPGIFYKIKKLLRSRARVDWGRVDWWRVDWGHVDWGRANWGRVNWGRVDWWRMDWWRSTGSSACQRYPAYICSDYPETPRDATDFSRFEQFGLVDGSWTARARTRTASAEWEAVHHRSSTSSRLNQLVKYACSY